MWFLMSLTGPSFPHTLQISANWCLLALRFWLFSIIEFTSFSSSSKSPELFPGIANVPFSPRLWIFLLGACLWTTVFGIFAGETETFQFFHLFQTLQLEFFSNSQYERNQTLLENICFPMIKVHNVQEIFRLQPSFYKLVGEDACSFQAASGKETESSQDHLVCFHLLTILTGQSHIIKVVVLSKASNAILMFSWKLFHWRHSFSDMPMQKFIWSK